MPGSLGIEHGAGRQNGKGCFHRCGADLGSAQGWNQCGRDVDMLGEYPRWEAGAQMLEKKLLSRPQNNRRPCGIALSVRSCTAQAFETLLKNKTVLISNSTLSCD